MPEFSSGNVVANIKRKIMKKPTIIYSDNKIMATISRTLENDEKDSVLTLILTAIRNDYTRENIKSNEEVMSVGLFENIVDVARQIAKHEKKNLIVSGLYHREGRIMTRGITPEDYSVINHVDTGGICLPLLVREAKELTKLDIPIRVSARQMRSSRARGILLQKNYQGEYYESGFYARIDRDRLFLPRDVKVLFDVTEMESFEHLKIDSYDGDYSRIEIVGRANDNIKKSTIDLRSDHLESKDKSWTIGTKWPEISDGLQDVIRFKTNKLFSDDILSIDPSVVEVIKKKGIQLTYSKDQIDSYYRLNHNPIFEFSSKIFSTLFNNKILSGKENDDGSNEKLTFDRMVCDIPLRYNEGPESHFFVVKDFENNTSLRNEIIKNSLKILPNNQIIWFTDYLKNTLILSDLLSEEDRSSNSIPVSFKLLLTDPLHEGLKKILIPEELLHKVERKQDSPEI